MSWIVYRVTDSDGRCIYAGMTSDLDARRKAHLSNLPEAVEVNPYATFDEKWDAIRVESLLIRSERPRHNIKDNPGHGRAPESDRDKAARLVDELVRQHLEHQSLFQYAQQSQPTRDAGDATLRLLAELREARAVMKAMAAGLSAAAEELAR